jgi:hypothetical protein
MGNHRTRPHKIRNAFKAALLDERFAGLQNSQWTGSPGSGPVRPKRKKAFRTRLKEHRWVLFFPVRFCSHDPLV